MSIVRGFQSRITEDIWTKCSIGAMIHSDLMVKFDSRSWIPLDPLANVWKCIFSPFTVQSTERSQTGATFTYSPVDMIFVDKSSSLVFHDHEKYCRHYKN